MTVGVYTHEMKNELGDDGAACRCATRSTVNSALASVNEILVTVRPAGEKQDPAPGRKPRTPPRIQRQKKIRKTNRKA